MSEELVLIRDPKCTALVVIDLQHGIVGRTPAPHSGPDVVARCNAIAGALRKAGGTIFWRNQV